jgi:hypothetical protein
MIEVSPRVKSTGAFQEFKPAGATEFIFDPTTNTFVVAGQRVAGSHAALAEAISANETKVVGGMFSRGPNGEITTNEWSGHYGQNWNDAVRQQFKSFMESKTGKPVMHERW